jgi:hypothetical protein
MPSARSSQKQRQEQREEKLAVLRALVARLAQLPADERTKVHDVKGWLAEKSHLERHFITRALNKGLLTIPTQGEHQK